MNVKFLRVNGVRSHLAGVVAIVDGIRVKWNRSPGWSCDCDEWLEGSDDDTCPHIEAVVELLDDRVLGEAG